MRFVIPGLLALASLAWASVARADVHNDAELGRACAQDFYQNRLEALWQRMTPAMRKAFGDRSGLTQFRQQVEQDVGQEVEVLGEHQHPMQDTLVYSRASRFSRNGDTLQLQCVLDDKQRIVGFLIQPAAAAATPAPTAYLDYQTKAALQLPFTGEWYTFWGGRTTEQNYHVVSRGQRFAYDFMVVQDGSSHHDDANKNENYYCWDKKILAPAAGTVVFVKEGLPDNEPGVMDKANPPGNHVVLDLGNNEFALLAHLRQSSIAVKVGEHVSSGQELGRCGNSGNTSEPHLHFHLQNASTFGQGEGLPAFFNDYLADGNRVARGEPLRGQTISKPYYNSTGAN